MAAILFTMSLALSLAVSWIEGSPLACVRRVNGQEDFSEFFTVRFLSQNGSIVSNCSGARIAYDMAITLSSCAHVNMSVEFEYVDSRIKTHGRINSRKSAKVKEKRGNRVTTRRFSIRKTRVIDEIAIVYLKRQWEYNYTPEDFKQAPVFLASREIQSSAPELHVTSYSAGADGRLDSVKLYRSLESRNAKMCYSVAKGNEGVHFQRGSPLVAMFDRIPVLIGIAIESIPGCHRFFDITSIEGQLQQELRHAPFRASWFYPSASYVEYIKGDIQNDVYHKWWVVTYNATMRAQQKVEDDRAIYGSQVNPDAQPLTGEGYVLESLDSRHRYGRCLKLYHARWTEDVRKGKVDADQGFFEWFDLGEGREADAGGSCSRDELEMMTVEFCDEMERKLYEVDFSVDPATKTLQLLYTTTKEPVKAPARRIGKSKLKTNWMFVWDLSRKFYVGYKSTGAFHHSSFVAGQPVLAAGTLATDDNGTLIALARRSGHYKPSVKHMYSLREYLNNLGADLDSVQMIRS